ncbi:MAG: thiamine pyrophosphate-dependent enzyme [Aliidongia sp.]
MTFGNPDFVAYARSYGAQGHHVGAVADLIPTLEAAFAAGGVHLVAVPIDYSENTRVLVEELRNRNAARAAQPD